MANVPWFPRFKLKLEKHSPEIMVGAGIAGMVVGTVLACRATLRFPELKARFTEDLDKVKDAVENDEDYTEKDRRSDVGKIALHHGYQFVKLYALPALVLGSSAVVIFKGHNITVQRNASLTSAVAGLTTSLNAYRERVKDSVGAEKEKDLFYDLHKEKQEVEGEDGKKKTVTVKSTRALELPSIYTAFFDDSSKRWSNSPELNKVFLLSQQSYMNDILNARGHLFLNEVLDALDIPRTGAGASCGWILSKDDSLGDNYVDFGLFDADDEMVRRFMNGEETSIMLDFNVNGMIIDMI